MIQGKIATPRVVMTVHNPVIVCISSHLDRTRWRSAVEAGWSRGRQDESNLAQALGWGKDDVALDTK